MTLLKQIRRERDIAFDKAREKIWAVRYSDRPLWPAEIQEAVRHARQLQWNAATVYRWKLRQLDRPVRKAEAA